MSKKIAGGADKILLDVKVGKGALLQTREDANKLSELMIKIGNNYGREVHTIISDMNVPLGRAIGNRIEVLEAIDVLTNKEKDTNLVNLCIELASEMVSMSKTISLEEATTLVKDSLTSGKALNKFLEIVQYQGGDIGSLRLSDKVVEIKAKMSGTIETIDALILGKLSVSLGAGRINKEDNIDNSVGIYLEKLVGDKVEVGDTLAKIYFNKEVSFENIDKAFAIK